MVTSAKGEPRELLTPIGLADLNRCAISSSKYKLGRVVSRCVAPRCYLCGAPNKADRRCSSRRANMSLVSQLLARMKNRRIGAQNCLHGGNEKKRA